MKKPRKVNGRKLSAILQSLPAQFPSGSITIDDLNTTLAGRAYGLLLLILALPNLIPLPTPGLSATVGAPLMLVTLQHAWGKKTPWLPRFIAQKKIPRSNFKRMITRIVPYLKHMEKYMRPRLRFLVRPPADRIIAFVCFILSLMIMLPVPFGNAIPAFAICLFAFSMLQNDGVCAIIGLVVTALGGAAIVVFSDVVIDSVTSFGM